MKQNVGTLDRAGRLFLSVLLLAIAWKRQDKLGILAASSAGMLLSSSLSGFCPLYKIAGIDTSSK